MGWDQVSSQDSGSDSLTAFRGSIQRTREAGITSCNKGEDIPGTDSDDQEEVTAKAGEIKLLSR
jgi:hypothetical protein